MKKLLKKLLFVSLVALFMVPSAGYADWWKNDSGHGQAYYKHHRFRHRDFDHRFRDYHSYNRYRGHHRYGYGHYGYRRSFPRHHHGYYDYHYRRW